MPGAKGGHMARPFFLPSSHDRNVEKIRQSSAVIRLPWPYRRQLLQRRHWTISESPERFASCRNSLHSLWSPASYNHSTPFWELRLAKSSEPCPLSICYLIASRCNLRDTRQHQERVLVLAVAVLVRQHLVCRVRLVSSNAKIHAEVSELSRYVVIESG